MASTSILDLSKSVATNTAIYYNFLVAHGHPLASHNPAVLPVPLSLPPDIEAARDAAIQASFDLHELLIGLYGIVLNGLSQVLLSLIILFDYRLFY